MRQIIIAIVATALALAPGSMLAVETGFSSQKEAPNQADFAGWLSQLAKSYLTAELERPGQSIESIKITVPASSRAPEGYDSLEITIPHRGGQGAKVFLLVSFSQKERIVARLNVIAEVKVSREVVVTKRSISRGSVLGSDDLEVVIKTMGPLEKSTVPEISKVVGMQADRNIRDGAILRLNQLSWPKMVRAGDVVSVVARSGSMVITVTGEAKQDGNRGEWIKVINTASKKTISARVTGPGEVKVKF